MARLDRLAPVKETAQIGAALGRQFSHELIAAMSPLREKELKDALGQLVQSGLIYRQGTPPDATYSFKHALVQDTAYQSLRHFTAAGITESAIAYWAKAASRARKGSWSSPASP
jgi:predicted ATPase